MEKTKNLETKVEVITQLEPVPFPAGEADKKLSDKPVEQVQSGKVIVDLVKQI